MIIRPSIDTLSLQTVTVQQDDTTHSVVTCCRPVVLKAPASTEVMDRELKESVVGHPDPQSDAPTMLSVPFVLLHVQPPHEYGSCRIGGAKGQ